MAPRPGAVARASWIALLDTLLPPLCPGCGVQLGSPRWICSACRRRFEARRDTRVCFACRIRGRPEGNRRAGMGCGEPGHRLHGHGVFWMGDPLDTVIHAFKYRGQRALGRPLGRLLAHQVAIPAGALIAPLPLHRTRLRERGYNQAALLARAAAERWGAPCVDGVLARTRATRPQAGIEAGGRKDNIRGAFTILQRGAAAGRCWVLVDDVATTGSTLGEAAAALLEAGAERVVPVVLALA